MSGNRLHKNHTAVKLELLMINYLFLLFLL